MPADPAAARARLAADQQALLAALVTGGEPPAGFDAQRVRIQAGALLAKRTRVAAHHHPWLAAALGSHYAAAFAGYAAVHPLPAGGTSRTDAASFEAHLAARGTLPRRPRGWRRA